MGSPQERLRAAPLLIIFGVLLVVQQFHRLSSVAAHAAIGVMTACTCGLMILVPGWGVFPILFFILDPVVMVLFPLRIGLLWNGIFALTTGVIFIANGGINGILQWLIYNTGYFFFGSFGYAMAQADKDRKFSEQVLSELREAHQKLQDYTNQLEELTIAQERNRIAREMHDTLGHRLTIAAVQLEGAQRLVRKDPEKAENMIGTVREQIKEGLSDLRRTVAMLRASPDEDMPIGSALEKLAHQTTEVTGLQIHLVLEDSVPELPAPYRLALYRTAQEGLTNIQRHARATDAWLQLLCQGDCITLLVGDNGVGASSGSAQAGFGLSGLRERAALLGGELFIDPRPGGGTQLSLRLPIIEKRAEHE
jgi:signal transduction histidine kinase